MACKDTPHVPNGTVESNPFDTQVGGSHYKDMAIQPIEYCYKNKMDPFQTYAIKYISRVGKKGPPVEDIDKAIHLLQMYKETFK